MEELLWPQGAPFATGTGDEDKPAVTPYLASNKESKTAAVVVCPGGGYEMRADHEGEPIALWMNTLGISAFVLRYRVAPYRNPVPLTDVQRAIRYVRHRADEWNIDPQRVGVLGFSAGGHLAATAATLYDRGATDAEDPVDRQSSRPDLAIFCYPVISMREGITHEGSRNNLLGPNPDESLIARFSCEENVTADTPPTFLWHTSEDGLVSAINSLLFASALKRNGIFFDLHVYEKGHHGLGLAEDNEHARTWTDQCASWLKQNGFRE
ncbi:alpha/beta hydrolase [Gorillibacterium timonense]|uniref:alpha/beta hydrolase n=1 Tax=Gorillibacterium timonense TaxID=1689269 RepID=UPI00071CB981|nr:alpha/beta hydrolase [Gorillibacterium timonense]